MQFNIFYIFSHFRSLKLWTLIFLVGNSQKKKKEQKNNKNLK